MGINFGDTIPKKEITFAHLRDKKIAVDASNMLYQFLSSIRQRDGTPLMDSKGNITSHLQGIISRVSNLIDKGLKLVFVFDGKPPILKIKEREEREHRKQLAEKKLEQAREEKDEELILRYSKQTTRLTPQIIKESKELISALGLPIIQAPSEAEAQAAFIAEKGDVDFVASTDYDSLIYGAPNLLRNLTLSQRKRLPSGTYVTITPELIELKTVLNSLGIDKDKLLVLAILIGTDYNRKGVKGIGPKNALRLIKEYKNYNNLFKEVKADFDWKKIYATFKNMPIIKDYKLKWNKPNEEKIKDFLVNKHDFSEERINKILINLTKRKDKESSLNKWFKN